MADNDSVSSASASVGVTHSTVSQSVQVLERELGVPLFHRTGRGMVLTSGGHALLGPARRIVRESARSAAAISPDPDRGAPRLDIAVFGPALNGPIASIVAAYARQHDRTVLHVHDLPSEQDVADVLADGVTEIVCTRLPLAVGRAARGLEVLVVGDYTVVVVSPPGTSIATTGSGAEVELESLADLPVVLAAARHTLTTSMEAVLDENDRPLRPTAVVGHRETRDAWVLQGIGSTLMGSGPAGLAERHGAPVRTLRGAAPVQIGLVWNPLTITSAGRQLLEVARDLTAR